MVDARNQRRKCRRMALVSVTLTVTVNVLVRPMAHDPRITLNAYFTFNSGLRVGVKYFARRLMLGLIA